MKKALTRYLKNTLLILLAGACVSCNLNSPPSEDTPPADTEESAAGTLTEADTTQEEESTEPLPAPVEIPFIPGIGKVADGIKRDGPADVDWVGKWIWDDENTSDHNWVCMRKTVTLDTVPDIAVTRIAIDSRYWLWVNGEMVVYEGQVKRGPTENDTYFDTVNIAPYLREGENTIAILGWYFGNDSDYYSYKSSGAGGMLFQAELGDQTLISDSSWKVHKHTGYQISTQETDPGSQPNYRLPEENIFYNARKAEDLEGWYLPEYDDSQWERATEYGVAGDQPWNQLWQRSIPLLAWSDILPYENPTSYAKYTDTATKRDVRLVMRCPYNMQIQPYLKVEAKAGCTIQILSDGTETVRTTYVTTNGVQEFEGFGWMSCQKVTYVFSAGIKILELGYRQTGYDTDFRGSFTCDDEAFDQLWQESLYTLYITMRDNYMDCPDRERAQWWGDVTNESLMTFYSLDPDAYLLYRKGVDTLIQWRGHNGTGERVLPTVVPINQGHFELPMQQLAGVVGFWTYYTYTGDTEFLKQVYEPAFRYLMTWQIAGNGLVRHNPGSWDWADWGDNCDVTVMENAWYYWACACVMDMGRVLNDHTYDSQIEERMSGIKAASVKLWNPSIKAYHSHTSKGYADERANALMVLSGLADEAYYEDILKVLVEVREASPYMEKYVLDTMFLLGAEEEALDRIKARYAKMLNDEWTTLWEYFPAGGTHNHAWSGGPMIAMSRYVAGIAPDEAGYKTYHVIPQLGYLNRVNCTVPSIKGDIVLALERGQGKVTMTLTSPEDTVARVGIPVGAYATVTCGGVTVYENGAGTGAVAGVEFLSADGEYIYFALQPGTWALEASDPN